MKKEDVIQKLKSLGNLEKVGFKAERFGVITKSITLGVYHNDLKILAKEIGKNTALGVALFDTGIYEARLLCSKICKPSEVSEELLDDWVETFDTWEICDSFCMGLIKYHPLALKKAFEWSSREEEFVKRAGLVLMAVYGFANKEAENAVFESFFPVLLREASDNRNFVMKAVNWAIRQIGKRNQDLRKSAIILAEKISLIQEPSAKWISKDALKELNGEKLNVLDYPRAIYRP